MKAIVVTDQAAGTAGMKLAERPEPQGAALASLSGANYGDVIVEVYASGFTGDELAWPSTWIDRLAGRAARRRGTKSACAVHRAAQHDAALRGGARTRRSHGCGIEYRRDRAPAERADPAPRRLRPVRAGISELGHGAGHSAAFGPWLAIDRSRAASGDGRVPKPCLEVTHGFPASSVAVRSAGVATSAAMTWISALPV